MATQFPARLIGLIEGCTNPESAELLLDGETFVFGNCAMSINVPAFRPNGIVYLGRLAFVSRARLAPDGSVELDQRNLIGGLTGTLGCDVLRTATSRFPAGTVFMAEGGEPNSPDGQTLEQNPKPRALAFDPYAGKVLGAIPLWKDSEIGRRFNGLEQPNGLALDSEGNLYVGDIPNANPDPNGPPRVPSAVYRIPHTALDPLAEETSGAADGVRRVLMPGNVNGVTVSPVDDTCWAVSCSPRDPAKGAIYHLALDTFESGQQPPPFQQGLGILDGVGVTRRGTVLASNPVTGEIFAFPESGEQLLVVAPDNPVKMPADFNVIYPSFLGGEPALLVPDISRGKEPGTGVVAILDVTGL